MEKILTIVIPTYNMEKYLDKCLTSLIVEDELLMKQLEILVVIDGGKDDSSKIARKYQEQYPDTIVVIEKENGNYGSCVNRGIKEATGKYFKVLDADDWFDTQNLCTYINKLKDIEVDLVLTDFVDVVEGGEVLKTKRYSDQGLESNRLISIDELMKMQPVFYGQMHGFTYRTGLLKGMDYHQIEGVSFSDWEYVNVPFTQVKKVCYCPIVLYNYLKGREGQTMTTIMNKSVGQLMMVLLDICKSLGGRDYNKDLYDVYLKKQLDIQLVQIYYSGICLESFDDNILREFDLALAGYPKCYDLCNKYTFLKIKYVKMWRKHRRLSGCLKFVLKCIQAIV